MNPFVVAAAALVVVGLVLVAVGVGLWSVPGGLVVGGVEAVCGGYVVAYLTAKGVSRR